MPPVLHFMLFTSWKCENFTELHYNIAKGIVILQCNLNRCRQSSTFEQTHVFPPGKFCSPSATTAAQRSAVPRHWCHGVIAGFLSNEQTGDNLMVRCQDCRADAATVSCQNSWWHTYVPPRFVMEEQHLRHLWDELDESEHSEAEFSIAVGVHRYPPKKFKRITFFLAQSC
jgi:hypothetical protein